MSNPVQYYNRLSLLSVLILLVLVSLQVFWVVKAVRFQEREIVHQLKEVVGGAGLEINSVEHRAFHGEMGAMDSIPTEVLAEKLNAYLKMQGISGKTYFAIYQDTIGGIFRSNHNAFRTELLESEVRTCLSCIVSFWTVPKADSTIVNWEDPDRKELNESSVFNYYSPVASLDGPPGETLWLALYQPGTLSAAIRSMVYLFVLNIALLLALLALVRHLIRSLSRHKQLAKVKSDFFNNMTHEFKTPIGSIRLASSVLRAENDPDKRRTYYDLIEKESRSLEHQIDKLLELSLLENDQLTLEMEPVDLCGMVHEIPHKMKLLLEERSGQLHLDCKVEDITVKGDSYHLQSSLCNLVENSLKYAREEVNIWIVVRRVVEKVRIAVRDDGPGIRAEDRVRVFSRFYRGQEDRMRKGGGFGIGLSYVKSIVEAHGGTIRLNDDYKEGTEFIIEL